MFVLLLSLFRRLDRSADAALPLSIEKSRRPDFSRYGKNELRDQWNVDITLFTINRSCIKNHSMKTFSERFEGSS